MTSREERRVRTVLLRHSGCRQAIELAIPARLLWPVVQSIADHRHSSQEERDWGAPLLADLRIACWEPIVGLPAPAARTVADATTKTCLLALGEMEARAGGSLPAIKAGLTVLYWLEAVVGRGVLTLETDTPGERAINAVISAFNEAPHLWNRYERGARKLARWLDGRLKELGLFDYPELTAEAAHAA